MIRKAILAVSLLLVLTAINPPTAKAASCLDWSLRQADMGGFNGSPTLTVYDTKSLDQIATALYLLEGFPTEVPLAGGKRLFQSSTGIILEQDGVVSQWQTYTTYRLFNEWGDITVVVKVNPAMPNRAYWFYLPDFTSFGQYSPCKAIETPLYVADQVWLNFIELSR